MVTMAGILEGEDADDGDPPVDFAAAVVWLQKAAATGSRDAMVKLAEKYDDGVDVPASRAEGFTWYLKADAIEDSYPWDVRRVLAQKYKTGDGTAKNLAEAARLHVEVAENSGGWRKHMRAGDYSGDVARSEEGYRRAVQQELANRGLYKGAVEGVVTPELGEAIKAMWKRKVKDE